MTAKARTFCFVVVINDANETGSEDFAFINTESINRLCVTVEIRQKQPCRLNEGNTCVNFQEQNHSVLGWKGARRSNDLRWSGWKKET